MTKKRQNEIRKESERRTKLWLEKTTFHNMSFYGSYRTFNANLHLLNLNFIQLAEGMDHNEFCGFVTEEEYREWGYESATRDVFYKYLDKYPVEEPNYNQEEVEQHLEDCNEDTDRVVSETFTSTNILGVTVANSREGFVHITFTDKGNTVWNAQVRTNGYDGFIVNQPESVTLTLGGDSERDTLVEALEFIVKELKENPEVVKP